MTKFKVGDKVRRVRYSHWPEEYGELGKVYTVLGVNSIGYIQVIEDKPFAYYNTFELVEEAMDLTKIEKPFGLLDEATQQALKDHGGPIECYSGYTWIVVASPLWSSASTYRSQAQPEKTKVELELTQEELDTIKKVLGRTGI
jgi:hypothetical protein